jgi:hypothetical protein
VTVVPATVHTDGVAEVRVGTQAGFTPSTGVSVKGGSPGLLGPGLAKVMGCAASTVTCVDADEGVDVTAEPSAVALVTASKV